MSQTVKQQYFYGVGRRKASTARAKYYPSTSPLVITVNKRKLEDYFEAHFLKVITDALENLSIKEGTFNLFINGGGVSGQAGAGQLAIAKALIKFDENLRPRAKQFKYLTTDIRKVLPKRPGLRKARKTEQWSKR
jgi:small subunit ribosomal protein S9